MWGMLLLGWDAPNLLATPANGSQGRWVAELPLLVLVGGVAPQTGAIFVGFSVVYFSRGTLPPKKGERKGTTGGPRKTSADFVGLCLRLARNQKAVGLSSIQRATEETKKRPC